MTPSSPSRGRATAVRAMPLVHADVGEVVRIIRIRAEGRDVQSMIAAGLCIGRVCPVVGRLPGGGVLVAVDDRRLAVGGATASEIWVRLVDA